MFGSHFHTQFSIEKARTGLKQGRNLEAGADAEAMEGGAYWFASHGLLSLLSYRTQITNPGMATPTMCWALPHQSPVKKMPHRIACSLIVRRDFLGVPPLR